MESIGLKAVMDMVGFTAGINKYNQMVSGASTHTDKNASIMSKAFAGIGTAVKVGSAVVAGGIAAITTAMIGGVMAASKWAETVDGVGDVLGTTAEESSALAVAARYIGGDVTQLTSQMAILTRGLFDAKGEIGPTGLVLQNMGVAFQDANGQMLPTTDILQSVADKIGNMPDGLEKTQLMMDLFGKSGKDMSDMMGVLANGGMEAMNQKAKDMGLSMSEEGTEGAIAFGRSMNELKLMGQGLMVTIGNELLPVLQPLIADFMELAQQALPYVKKGLDFLVPILTDLITLIREGKWGELGEKIADGIKKLWDILVNWFNSVDWAELGRTIYTKIRDWVKLSAWPWLKNAFVDVKDAIVAWFKSVDWPELGRIIFTTVKNFITNSAWPWLKNAFVDVKDAIVAWFKSVDWVELGRIIFTAVKNFITNDAWPWLKQAFIDVKDAIVNWFKSVDWAQLGKDVIDGLIKGIKDGAGALGGVIQDIVNAIINEVKKAFGIGSPSKVMMGFGYNLMEGLALGIDKGANLPIDSLASAMSGFSGAIQGRFRTQHIDPLTAQQQAIMDRITMYREGLAGATSPEEAAMYNLQLSRAQKEYTAVTEELVKYKEQELALEKQLADLAFLQQQMDFIAFLQENELDMADILGDLQLGLDLDLPAFMDAMIAAISELVMNLNMAASGDIASLPGEGFAGGGQAFGKPGGGTQIYNNQQVNLYVNASINNGMDLQAFDTHVLELVSGAL